jgi:hypothetical protein
MTSKIVMRGRSEVLVIALVGKDMALKWWKSYNRAFGQTPEEQWEKDAEVVYNYLMKYTSGDYQ